MIESRRKEEISISYLNALCAQEGISMECLKHDDDGIDFILKKIVKRRDGSFFSSSFEVQLKSTSSIRLERGQSFSYPLKKKNYDDLRRPSTAKPFLFLLILPEEEEHWLAHSVDELVIRKCMYWLDLKGLPDNDNVSSVTVHFPQENVVSPEMLRSTIMRIAEGELL